MEPQTNGSGHAGEASIAKPRFLPEVLQALQAVHSPHSSNERRQDATAYLERAKTDGQAPLLGFNLAIDREQSPVVRHYGISILEYALRYRWDDFGDEQITALRDWILRLAHNICEEDVSFLRNKVAQLWVDMAKRTWGSEWMDMDSMLLQLWSSKMVHKEFVLTVLEGLSEEIFNSEDTMAALRGATLNRACVEIFTPAVVLMEHFSDREAVEGIRAGQEGWLIRLGNFISEYVNSGSHNSQQDSLYIVKTLETLAATMNWAIPQAIIMAQSLEHTCSCLGIPNVSIQTAAVEALSSLFRRGHLSDSDFVEMICPIFTPKSLNLLRQIYEWSTVDVSDINEEKYNLAKKLSGMISQLAAYVDQRPADIPQEADISGFLNLLLQVAKNQSLMVSIPAISLWVKILKPDRAGRDDTIMQFMGPLLELCSQRLVRYENLPEDTSDPSFLFLVEDIDTLPERHAFVGNYRRFCSDIVALIVEEKPFEALYHMLSQVDQYLKALSESQQSVQIDTYLKSSLPLLGADAQFTVVESALRGYMKWRQAHGSNLEQQEVDRNALETDLEKWCSSLLEMDFTDPLIRKRILQVAVTFSTSALDNKTAFMFNVLEHLLKNTPNANSQLNEDYKSALKDLQSSSAFELQRLCTKLPDKLMVAYDALEQSVRRLLETSKFDKRTEIAYYSCPFILRLRATGQDEQIQQQQLSQSLSHALQVWESVDFREAVSSLDGFRNLLCLNEVQTYLVNHQVQKISDWSQYRLDEEGTNLQLLLTTRLDELPIRVLKTLLGLSTEKVKTGSSAYKTSCILWAEVIPRVLPHLLNLLSQSHAIHNPDCWTILPNNMRIPVTSKILTDRFWQAAISGGTRDDFFARVGETRKTMEGFASSVRGTLRTVRESGYSIIYCMSRLGEHFYGYKELPQPLAKALFKDAHFLSTHQFTILLTMVRHVVDDCPPSLRSQFLPPILASLITQMDNKITSEWNAINQKISATTETDDLTEEMKAESVLRQLTYSAITTIATLLDPKNEDPRPSQPLDSDGNPVQQNSTPEPLYPTMRRFTLSTPSVLEPLFPFSAHALRMRDSRSCVVMIRILHDIIKEFTTNDDPTVAQIREYMCNEILKASITSLNDPYFVDLQRDLALLIATIFISYSPLTDTPRQILLSLPGMTEEKVGKTAQKLLQAGAMRQRRALVLDLLSGLRGISVAEQGKIEMGGSKRSRRSAMQEQFMSVDPALDNKSARQGSPDLSGVANMLDG